MAVTDKRERALNLIVSLRQVTTANGATQAEAENAMARIAELRTKYEIPEAKEHSAAWDDLMRKVKDQQAEAKRQRDYDEILRTMAREKAEAERRERIKNQDAYGRNLTDAEIAEALRDPLGWAIKQDGRTSQQKNDDMQDSFGKRDRYRNHSNTPKCASPLPFYTKGGYPRKRNTYGIACYSCGCWLEPQEGCVDKLDGRWVGQCCERVPGPRQKRERF